jgi:hypothetical protein
LASKKGSKGRSGGRVTPPSSSRGATRSSGRSRSVADGRATGPAEREAAPQRDVDVKAVDRLVARADPVVSGRVRSAFSGTGPLSPNLVTLLGSVPAIVVVAISVSVKTPVLLIVALAVMAASILGLMWGVNTTYVVAELPRELVVLSNHRGRLEPRFRVSDPLVVQPARDRRWVKVEVGGRRLWVSKRAFGGVVEALAADRDEAP